MTYPKKVKECKYGPVYDGDALNKAIGRLVSKHAIGTSYYKADIKVALNALDDLKLRLMASCI